MMPLRMISRFGMHFDEKQESRIPDLRGLTIPEFQIAIWKYSRIPDLRGLTLPEFQIFWNYSRIPEFQICEGELFQISRIPDCTLELFQSSRFARVNYSRIPDCTIWNNSRIPDMRGLTLPELQKSRFWNLE